MIQIGEPELIVPSGALPPTCAPCRSNNNLDACVVGSTTYLAWRTAPIHFASTKARIEVVSRDGDGAWRHETTVALGRDLREPRLVWHQGRLLLYFFTAGVHPLRFEPDRIQMMERGASGEWRDPQPVSPVDHVVWRVRSLGDRLVMSCYGDASGAYTTDRSPRAELWCSADGIAWETLFDSEALVPGTTETDFVVLPGGEMLIASRLESRGSGLGTQLAVLDADGKVRLSRHEARKFDSPALFNWRDRTFIVTRRQRAFGGRVEVMPAWLPVGPRDIGNQFLYWITPKATALYEIDRGSLAVSRIADLPGCGDTAFAAVLVDEGDDESDDVVTVYNYSSPLGSTYRPWVAGQLLSTQIHRVELHGIP